MNQNHSPDNIIQFPDTEEIERGRQTTALNIFESMANHLSLSPATDQDTNRYACRLLQYAGASDSELDDGLLKENAERLRTVRSSTHVSDKAWDNLIDKHSNDYDEAFAYIVNQIHATSENSEELEVERRALGVLLDLRVGAINVGIERQERWKNIARLLVGNFSKND